MFATRDVRCTSMIDFVSVETLQRRKEERSSMGRRILISAVLCAYFAPAALAQAVGDRIDLYFADWHASQAGNDRGLAERDIFTRGDPQSPSQKGAVLRFINSYKY